MLNLFLNRNSEKVINNRDVPLLLLNKKLYINAEEENHLHQRIHPAESSFLIEQPFLFSEKLGNFAEIA